IYDALPFNLPFNIWGDEIYFSIPVHLDLEEGREIMEVGGLAYWPTGNAFCIFYGRTPASTDERPRAASAVSPFGKIEGDATVLRQIKAGKIQVEKLEEG
ncbi:MAG: cyclophilin-like fold protein, partial [Candidatus Bathyarchaeia archaeon]